MGRQSPRGGQLVYIEEDSVKKLQALGAAIKTLGDRKELTKQLNKDIRKAADPMLQDMKQAARDLHFESQGGRSGTSRTKRTSTKNVKTGNIRKGKGLRDALAQGIRVQIDKSKNSAGIRIRMASKDADVNRLGSVLNRKGEIRHPLFGNMDNWYITKAPGSQNWFYGTAQKHLPATRKAIERTLDEWSAKVAAEVKKSA